MMHGCKADSLRELTRVFREGTLTGFSDRLLLTQFVDHRDDAAFEALLRRHGPLVLNICRKLLCDRHEVEDAFQATFLVLVRKAGSLTFEGSLSPWISTVAYRIAARARERRIRQNTRERKSEELINIRATPEADHDETSRVIHEELNRLPERLRAAIVCCHLDGMTHEATAAQLGCPVGTVRSRLVRARARLQARLVRRGVTLTDGTLGMLLSRSSGSHLPARLLRSTVSLTFDSGVQPAGAGVATASVLSLVEGVLNQMVLRKVAFANLIFMPLGALIFAGVALAFTQSGGGDTPVARPEKPKARQEAMVAPASIFAKTYYIGDIIGREGNSKLSPDASQINMAPLMNLIVSTIAPGTWRIVDQSGTEIRIETDPRKVVTNGKTDPERVIGTLTPFFLSVSLIVRHTAEVHDQVANLLKCLREYRFQPVKYDSVKTSADRVVPPAPEASPAPAARHPADGPGERKKRLKQLLEQVQHEIDAMDQDSDHPARPGFTGR